MYRILALIAFIASLHAQAPTRSMPVMFTGSGYPEAGCVTGNLFFRTDAPSGQNLYVCNGGTWSPLTYSTSAATGLYGKLSERGKCAVGNTGQIVMYSDSLIQSFCDGNQWIDTYLNRRIVPPVWNVDKPAENQHVWSMGWKPIAGVAEIELGIRPTGLWGAGDRCALGLRDSASGKFITISTLSVEANGNQVVSIEKWSTVSMRDSEYVSSKGLIRSGSDLTVAKISITDKIRTFSVSQDLMHWDQLLATSVKDFITPDQYGFGCISVRPESTAWADFMHLSAK